MSTHRSIASRLWHDRTFLWACLIAANIAMLVLAVLIISIIYGQFFSTP